MVQAGALLRATLVEHRSTLIVIVGRHTVSVVGGGVRPGWTQAPARGVRARRLHWQLGHSIAQSQADGRWRCRHFRSARAASPLSEAARIAYQTRPNMLARYAWTFALFRRRAEFAADRVRIFGTSGPRTGLAENAPAVSGDRGRSRNSILTPLPAGPRSLGRKCKSPLCHLSYYLRMRRTLTARRGSRDRRPTVSAGTRHAASLGGRESG